MENTEAQKMPNVSLEQLARQPIAQQSLNPGQGVFLEYTTPKKMIEENRAQLLKIVAKLRKTRAEEGFNGFNKPVVFLGGVQQDGRARGKRQGWFVDIIQFMVQGTQMQPVAIQRAQNDGYVVIDYDLPTPAEFRRIMDEKAGEAKDNTGKVLVEDDYKRVVDLVQYCEQAKQGISELWVSKDRNSEMEKKAQAAEQRAREAEAKLAKLEKAK